jgi:hypothetical protein
MQRASTPWCAMRTSGYAARAVSPSWFCPQSTRGR